MLSSVVAFQDGTASEAATIGNDGTTGFVLLVGDRASPSRVLQQVEGESLRISAADFRDVLPACPTLRQAVTRYALTLIQQSAQTAACNLRHQIRERMCRWLATSADRTGRDELVLTQEFLAVMLGVRRQSVSTIAVELQAAGLIRYRRGKVRIVDRSGLERAACECYRATRDGYARLMGMSDES